MDSLPPELFIDIIDSALHQAAQQDVDSWQASRLTSRLVRLEEFAIVSHSWRETIHNQPPLWNAVSSSDPICLVKKALERSENSPLTVYISQLPFRPDYNRVEEQFTSHCRRFLRLVGEHVHRWVSANLVIPYISLFDEFPTSPAPRLQSFSLSAEGAPKYPHGRFKWEHSTRPPNVFGGSVPSLRSLSLDMARLGWPVTSYRALRSLTISCETYSNTMTGDYILDILEAASSTLEELTFYLTTGGYSGSNTGHTAEIEESHAMVKVSNARNPPVQLNRLRSLDILELRDMGEVILYFDVPLCTNIKVESLPVDWSKEYQDHPEFLSASVLYKQLESVHRKYLSQIIAAIPPDDLVYQLEGSTRTWPSWHEGRLSVSSRASPDVRFVVAESRKEDMTWVTKQLPVGFMERRGLELRPAPGWSSQDFAVYTSIPEMEMVRTVVVGDGCSAVAVLQALCNTYTPTTGGAAWLLPSLTDLELEDRASPELVELLSTMVQRRQGSLGDGESAPEMPAARLRRVEMLVTEPGDADRLAELRDLLESA